MKKNWSVIMQRANLKTEVTRKQSTPNSPKNGHFLPPNTQTYISGGEKSSLFGKFSVLSFVETPVLRFALLTYDRRTYLGHKGNSNCF